MPEEHPEAHHVLVTGASSALGLAILRGIGQGGNVLLASCNSGCDRLAALADELPSPLAHLKADLSTREGAEGLIQAVEEHTPCPRSIVHLPAPKPTLVRFKDLGWADFEAHLNLQLRSAVLLLGRFLPRMAKAGGGRVVFVLSSYTLGPPPGALAHYVTAKHALLGLMRALASEYAGKGVTVNAVSPGMMQTPLLSEIPEKLVEITAAQHPMRRIATPEDVAPLVRFLLSPEAAYVNGVNIPVTGGAGI